MVLLCEGLVKIDTSDTAFARLNIHGHVDAPSDTALLEAFLERVFQMAQ
jgi:hypothetical protein